MSDSKLLGGSNHLCRLKTTSVGPVEQALNSTDAYMIYRVP
jgi:hypothetical protein